MDSSPGIWKSIHYELENSSNQYRFVDGAQITLLFPNMCQVNNAVAQNANQAVEGKGMKYIAPGAISIFAMTSNHPKQYGNSNVTKIESTVC